MKKQVKYAIGAVVTVALGVAGAIASITAKPDYIIISRADLMSRPTSGAAWEDVVKKADATVSPDMCDLNNKADVNALAAGIVYARTGDNAYRTKVINLIDAAMASQKDGCHSAVLRLGRQIGGYVMAADFAEYRGPVFVNWLDTIIDKDVGGHGRWNNLRWTAYDSSNNWGTFALASTTISDVYLNRTADIEKDWQVFSNYGVPHGWPFTRPALYQDAWSCVTDGPSNELPVAINPPCTKGGVNLDGAPVADASRATFPNYSGYIQESNQGFVVMAQVFSRAGYDGWGVNDRQVCRAAQFADRSGRLQMTSVAQFIPWMANHFCGLNIQTKTPTSGGRMFGFTDWLFAGPSNPPPIVTPVTKTPLPKTKTPVPVTKTPVPPTKTLVPPTNTLVVPTVTGTPPNTPVPPTSTVCDTIETEHYTLTICNK